MSAGRRALLALVAVAFGFILFHLLQVLPPSDHVEEQVGAWGAVRPGHKVALDATSKVLVTGAAGFIGMHLSLKLGAMGIETLGLDNFNDYYSVEFKRARAAHLKKAAGVDVVELDLCDHDGLTKLMAKHLFTHVVHLAAQPGVRYSIEHPLEYVERNGKCFVTLLEAVVAQKPKERPYLVYASSSSVYGLNEKIPFSEGDRVDRPSNLYGSTKRFNEITALAYHNIYKLPSVGCRFFTVYGPWGRPDMAAFKFADKIESGLPIKVYNGGKMMRDFTYVDDIVAGLVKIMEWRDEGGLPQVFNLGNNQPQELMRFIKVMEETLHKTAEVKDAGENRAEVKQTYADITLAREVLGFVPKTSIEEGLRRFADWYHSDARKASFSEVIMDRPISEGPK